MIYINGCEITISSNLKQLDFVKDSTISRALLNDGIDKQTQKLIIYSAEIVTRFSSVILLLGDSACLIERFIHKNCFNLLNHAIDIAE